MFNVHAISYDYFNQRQSFWNLRAGQYTRATTNTTKQISFGDSESMSKVNKNTFKVVISMAAAEIRLKRLFSFKWSLVAKTYKFFVVVHKSIEMVNSSLHGFSDVKIDNYCVILMFFFSIELGNIFSAIAVCYILKWIRSACSFSNEWQKSFFVHANLCQGTSQ